MEKQHGQRAAFPELDTQEWQEDDYDQQGCLLDPIKVKEGKKEEIDRVLKQKLFDYVPDSECAERQGRSYSPKWVTKKRGEKFRREIEKRDLRTRSSNRVMCCFLQGNF